VEEQEKERKEEEEWDKEKEEEREVDYIVSPSFFRVNQLVIKCFRKG